MSISEARNTAPRDRPGYSPEVASEVTVQRLFANAKRARSEADDTKSGTLRRQLLEIAQNYEEMAKTVEMVGRQRRIS
jgi:hypothetical protein